MKITTTEFLQNFHSLDGITIAERRKSLFLFLNRIEKADVSEMDFSAVEPRTRLEEKFKVDTLIYFKKVPELVELLKCEDPILINKVLKADAWFMEKAFQTGEQLVTEVFPYVSFRTKEKILNKLSLYLKDTRRANEFYEAVNNKYGLYLATKLIASCSLEVIMNHIQSTKRNMFTPRQLKIIFERYPEMREHIFKMRVNSDSDEADDGYKSILISVANYNTDLSLHYGKQYNVKFSVGRRITKKFIKLHKQDVIDNPDFYMEFLHNKQIAMNLNEEYKIFYFNLFPAAVKDFESKYYHIFEIFTGLPKRMKKLSLFLSTFEKAYGSQLWNYPAFITKNLLKLLTTEEREDLMKIQYSSSMNISEIEWCIYLKTHKSFSILKKKLFSASYYWEKREVIMSLLRTCKLNEDTDGLADVCKYMIDHYDEDHVSLKGAFLEELVRSFKLETLEEKHWRFIKEISQIAMQEVEGYCPDRFHNTSTLSEAYIHYCLLHGLPIKEHLIKWLETSNTHFNIIKENSAYEKQCLLAFGELIPQVMKAKESELYVKFSFLCALISWNERHSSDEIPVFNYADILESAKHYMLKCPDGYSNISVVKYFLQMKTNLEERQKFLKFYLAQPHVDIKTINWLIQHEPLAVSENIENITLSLLNKEMIYGKHNRGSFFWMCSNDYEHLRIPSQILNICMKILKEEGNNLNLITHNAVTALSYRKPSEEFLKVIVRYYPSNLRVDPKSKEDRETYQFQQNIGVCLKNVIPPSQSLKGILGFCKGDYFKLILRSLYSVTNNINENKLPIFFNELAGHAVSIRKHAIHLTFRVLDKEQIKQVLDHFMRTDANASIRKFIFKCAFNFFVTNPSNPAWELVKLNITAVDANDEETFDVMQQQDKIPEQYLAKYVPFMWNFLEKIPKRKYSRIALLNLIRPENVNFFPREFFDILIKNHFFKSEDGAGLSGTQSDIQSCVCRYVIYCDSQVEQEERLNFTCSIVKDYVINNWNNPEIRQEAHNFATNFLKEFCLEFLNNKCPDKTLLMKFIDFWTSILKVHEIFDEYLHLQFTLLYIENLPLPQVGKKLAELCNSLVDIYGPIIVGIFYNKVNFFCDYFLCDAKEEDHFILIQYLVKDNTSVTCALLSILLLSNKIPVSSEAKIVYSAIIEKLESRLEPIIQLYLQSHYSGITNLSHEYC